MYRRILGAIFLGLLSAALPARLSLADGSPHDSHSNIVVVQQQQMPADDDPVAKLDRILRQVGTLRQSIFKVFGTPDELAAVPDLAQELTIGEQAIRAARHVATDSEMHSLINWLNADRDLLFSLIARHPSNPTLVNIGLAYATTRRARFEREQFVEAFDWKNSVETNRPALWEKLRQAQDRFTDLSVLPTFIGGPQRDQIRQEAQAITALEKSVFASGGVRRLYAIPFASDAAYTSADQLIANVNFGNVLIVYAVYDQIRGPMKNGVLERGAPQYLAVVGHAGAPLRAIKLGPASTIDALERAFLRSVEKSPTNDAPFDKGPAEELYRTILAPLRPYFRYNDGEYSSPLLFIVPDGTLLCIPFAALVDHGKFLIDEFRLSLLDSPADANLFARANLAPSTRFLAFANPTLAPGVSARLQPLAEADREAAQIAALWPADQQQILSHSAATPAALSANAGTVGILHIASHGVFAANLLGLPEPQVVVQPEIKNDATGLMASSLARSVVLLAPDRMSRTGFVSGLAVLSLDLTHTQMVVLAACDTGIGDRERGEGIYGLRRAFLEAGAETVVSSLWSVDSAGTREFMVSFYRNLFQGQGRGEALQHAAAFTRLKYPHPYYWAAFVITGNLGRLKLPKED